MTDVIDGAALLAEIHRLKARIRELESPAIDAKRAEIRSSYIELISQAEQDRDYEGVFGVQGLLREREERWAAEDSAARQFTATVVSTEAPQNMRAAA
ncbi:hypothetical protein OG905_18895 [Streptomyces sp. NBC_00322]|uniref:hypothetical protein n=1 Tax=Streptomyces sp. NBC_00322 TaxID=2975712 RepID=UPI002E29F3C0|nr:hypothetical protein [Streptomyces sp. NBC_00322]